VQYTKGAKYLQKNLPFHGGKAHGGSGYMQILSLETAAFHFPGGFDFDRSSSLVHCEKKKLQHDSAELRVSQRFLIESPDFQEVSKKISNFSFLCHLFLGKFLCRTIAVVRLYI
jgi:hypothetical protein